MVDFPLSLINSQFSSGNSDIFSLFFNQSNSATASTFSAGVTQDSDFARMLLAQMQNNALKILGGSSEEQQTTAFGESGNYANSINNLLSGSGLTDISSLQSGTDYLNTTSTADETDSIFSEQMISLLRLNQIKVYQGLIGKTVKARTTEGEEIEGVVTGVFWENNRFVLTVANKKVIPESVTEVLG